MSKFISRVFNWFHHRDTMPAEIRRAQQLISAIDSGGIPLDSSRIIRIAEDLGLDVARSARMDDTIERIRKALARY